MKKKNIFRKLCILVVMGFLLAVLLSAWTPTAALAQPVKKKTWRLYTTGEGTFGYTVAMILIRVANKYSKNVELVVTTGKGSIASHSLYEKNECDSTYLNTQNMYDVWHNEGPFAKFPIKYKTYHTLWYSPMDNYFITKAGRTDINSLSDLAGKRVFPYRRGGGSYETNRLVLTKLGIWEKIIDRQMGFEEVGDALRTGRLDAAGVVSNRVLLPSWVKNIDMVTDVQAITPSAREKEIIRKIPGIMILPPFSPVGPSGYSKPVGVDKIWAFSNFYGMAFGPNEDTEEVYEIIKAWYEHIDELVAQAPPGFFDMFAKSGLEMNVEAIDSMKDIPVHPGVAKYYKERSIWKSDWKIGKLYPRP
jgi:TRAP transporter TAXI family solute receptor